MGAMRLQAEFVDHFGLRTVPNCTGLLNQERLCAFALDERPGFGFSHPFVVPNWAVYVPLDRYADLVPWIMQHRGKYDVLVHPNSGCIPNDHMDWSMWAGTKWQLVMPSQG